MAFRSRYWCNSKLADWIRGTDKPTSATSEGWDAWRSVASTKKVRYWIAETLLDNIQDVVNFPLDKLHDFHSWWSNRFIYKTHTIETGLKKGQWHETEDKILHGMFAELELFVETQAANSFGCKKRTTPRWWLHWFGKYRSMQAGIDHLIWEASLKVDHSWIGYESDTDVPEEQKPDDWMQPTGQALAAIEVLDLYVWWKFIRPNRADPMDASGYTEYFNMKEETGNGIMKYAVKSEEEKLWQEGAMNLCNAYEERYEEEDTEMLTRLINIRRTLWT